MKYGLYFSGDTSAGQVIALDRIANGNVVVGVRNQHALRNPLYEAELSADEIETLGRLCILLAKQMRSKP